MTRPFGAFVPGQTRPVFTVMAGDDCLLHFERDALNAKQRQDDLDNLVLTAMLQVALTYMGTSRDYVALHALFQEQPWAEALAFYNDTFARLLVDVVPPSNYRYYPTEGFYEAAAAGPMPGELLGLYMVSGSNMPLHASEEAWALSRRVNSKMHFAATAPAAGIPVPETMVCKRDALRSDAVTAFFERHGRVMIKLQGLAGARNVSSVASVDEALAYTADFPEDIDVALQERLPTDEYTEMTVDLTITDQDVTITNVRQILFADGLWVGNYICNDLTLSPRQREVCLQVGEYVRRLGYHAPTGLNCGIDFFVRGDDIVVIEINARLTGGLFPAWLIKRLGAEAEPTIAFIDMLSPARFADYRAFVQRHLEDDQGQGMRIVPMGFSPFVQNVDGQERIFVWQIVVGDYERFRVLKNEALGAEELPTVALIQPPAGARS